MSRPFRMIRLETCWLWLLLAFVAGGWLAASLLAA